MDYYLDSPFNGCISEEIVVCTGSPESSAMPDDDVEIVNAECQDSDRSMSPASVHMSDEIIIQSISLKPKEINSSFDYPSYENLSQEKTVEGKLQTDTKEYDTCSLTGKCISIQVASPIDISENVSICKITNSVRENVSQDSIVHPNISESVACDNIFVDKCGKAEITVNASSINVAENVTISKISTGDDMGISITRCSLGESTVHTNATEGSDKSKENTKTVKSTTVPIDDVDTVNKDVSKNTSVDNNVSESSFSLTNNEIISKSTVNIKNTVKSSVNQSNKRNASSSKRKKPRELEEVTVNVNISESAVSVRDGPNTTFGACVSETNSENANVSDL